VTSIRPFLQQGATLVVSPGFVPARTLARLADPELGITHYFCVPQMAAALRHEAGFDPAALSGLKALFTGGAPHPEAAIRAWLADGIAVVDGYGMSEAGTVFGMPLDPALIDGAAGAVGYAAPGVATRIVDAEDRDVAPGVPGELLLKGDNVGRGYWRRPDASAEAFTADGWFRTGDIVTADERGCHRIVDRRKDMFISGGENVFPGQIEAELAHMPGVRECAVIGVPDERWGEVGHVALVAAPGASIDLAAVLAHLEGRLARYKLPKHLSLHDALPRTGSGKIQKAVLKEMILRAAPTTRLA
jgi:fatty-acyl-CoA synthase